MPAKLDINHVEENIRHVLPDGVAAALESMKRNKPQEYFEVLKKECLWRWGKFDFGPMIYEAFATRPDIAALLASSQSSRSQKCPALKNYSSTMCWLTLSQLSVHSSSSSSSSSLAVTCGSPCVPTLQALLSSIRCQPSKASCRTVARPTATSP